LRKKAITALRYTPESLYKLLLREFEKNLPSADLKRGEWPSFWKAIMNNLAKSLDLEIKDEKPLRVDYSFYEHDFCDPLIATEIE
jgi:hypothetical protein